MHSTKKKISEYAGLNVDEKNIHLVFNRLLMMSVANLVVMPVQDVIGLGEEAMMNRPATADGNWKWRLEPGIFTKKHCTYLKKMNQLFQRS